ncbi:MAG: aldehyde dehydrogenase family protein [Cryomorphaceae bacterium]
MPRLDVKKTYKLFIGGKFPRTESGRYYPIYDDKGSLIANMCLGSRKDFRNAAVAARKAQAGWAGMTAYNRGQVLYRLAEMLETRGEAFTSELQSLGMSKKEAKVEVEASVDRLVYYAGWCDKYSAMFSSVNPTASAHFNFSVHEPTGVVAVLAPENSPLLGLISAMAPIIAGGNAAILLASQLKATTAISFAEVIQNSDVPGGVVNVLTGDAKELLPHMASHLDVNALVIARSGVDVKELLIASENVKRLIQWPSISTKQDPYKILDLQEVKTTWHPVQTSTAGSASY